jgi:uncharacterized protein with HEPN domain
MSPDKDRVRIRHMLEAARKAISFLDGRTKEQLQGDELRSLGIVRLIEIIGEAANQVSEPTRSAIPEVPWRAIAGTRNRLVHAYFDVDLDIVWQIVTSDLPPLVTSLDAWMATLVKPGGEPE